MTDSGAAEKQEAGIYVALTHDVLNSSAIMDKVRSPEAGAIVLFAGTTRDTFADRQVLDLTYQSYIPLALATLRSIATAVRQRHALKGIAITHRLGPVPIGEESILIAVSSPHRKAAWLAGEECLEEVKAKAEIWKLERFLDDEGGVWRANRDGGPGVRVTDAEQKPEEEGKEAGAEGSDETFGPVIRPRRPGESGHGPVVHPKPAAPSG